MLALTNTFLKILLNLGIRCVKGESLKTVDSARTEGVARQEGDRSHFSLSEVPRLCP